MTYNAENIKVLSDKEAIDRSPWLLVDTLANQYKRDREFIRRGLEACRLAGVSIDYFIGRYLIGDKTIEVNKEVSAISMELQKASVR